MNLTRFYSRVAMPRGPKNSYSAAVDSAKSILLGEDLDGKDSDDFRAQVERELSRRFPTLDTSSVSAAFEVAWQFLQDDPNDHQAD